MGVSATSCELFETAGSYAENAGGAREARCSDQVSLGATRCGREEYRAISCGVATRCSAAAASTGP